MDADAAVGGAGMQAGVAGPAGGRRGAGLTLPLRGSRSSREGAGSARLGPRTFETSSQQCPDCQSIPPLRMFPNCEHQHTITLYRP
jgi:hypothetical protein